MPEIHMRRRGLIVASAGLLLGRVLPAAAFNEEEPVAPVHQIVDGLLQIMKAGSATPFRQRFDMLAPVIDRTFDLGAILQASIGAPWATLTADQQAMLGQAFRVYTIASYVNSFDEFNGQRFEINPETRSVGNEQVVETRVIPKKGDSHKLDYVMRQGAGGWRVVDVLADGAVSRVAVQRSDFRRLLARGGAQSLADMLRAKSSDLSDGSI